MPARVDVRAADIGENITTEGLDLLALPRDTLLRIGAGAVVRITGLRNPCKQLDGFEPGLLAAVPERLPDGTHRRKAGGDVRPGDDIRIEWPATPHRPLERV